MQWEKQPKFQKRIPPVFSILVALSRYMRHDARFGKVRTRYCNDLRKADMPNLVLLALSGDLENLESFTKIDGKTCHRA